MFIDAGSLWEKRYNGSFNGKLRDELLNGEIFYSPKKVGILAEPRRIHYNTIGPRGSFG
jgi:putative transposase